MVLMPQTWARRTQATLGFQFGLSWSDLVTGGLLVQQSPQLVVGHSFFVYGHHRVMCTPPHFLNVRCETMTRGHIDLRILLLQSDAHRADAVMVISAMVAAKHALKLPRAPLGLCGHNPVGR